jgi:hypothetical protein
MRTILTFLAVAFAHHSFTAEYDSAKIMQFTGAVTKVEWMNPHARFYVDVKNAQGVVTNWNFELGSPIFLRKLGWKQDSLKVGDQVSVEGYLAKDGSKSRSQTAAAIWRDRRPKALRSNPRSFSLSC